MEEIKIVYCIVLYNKTPSNTADNNDNNLYSYISSTMPVLLL